MNRSTAFFVVVGAVALVLLAIAQTPWYDDEVEIETPAALEDAGAASISFPLEPRGRFGQVGSVTLAPVGRNRTRVGVELADPTGIPQPVEIRRGTCTATGERLYRLKPAVGPPGGAVAESVTVLAAPMGELAGGDLVLVVERSRRLEGLVSCGVIRASEQTEIRGARRDRSAHARR